MVANRRNHTGDILHHIGVPEADHAIAFAFQKARALLIFRDVGRMLAAVDLYDEPGPVRAEVRVIRAKRNLKSEFRVRESLAERTADALFRVRRIAAELARFFRGQGRQQLALGQAVRIPPHPPTPLRGAGPSLCQKGRGDVGFA